MSLQCLVVLFCCALTTYANHYGSPHQHFHRMPVRDSMQISEAEQTVRQALTAMRARNKARVENPKFNHEGFATPTKDPELAPPLD